MNHSFNIEYAKKYGIEEAVFIEHLIFWITKNKANEKHNHYNKTWTYNSAKAFTEIFPYMSESKIRRVLDNLIQQKILIKGNYNKKSYDRTIWYAFQDEEAFFKMNKCIYRKCEMDLPKMRNGFTENERTIPDINTDINTDDLKYKEREKQIFDIGLKIFQKQLSVIEVEVITNGIEKFGYENIFAVCKLGRLAEWKSLYSISKYFGDLQGLESAINNRKPKNKEKKVYEYQKNRKKLTAEDIERLNKC